MTCAVIPFPQASKPFWAGDADHLIDDLVAACESKPVLAPLPGFGRELVHFFDTGFAELSPMTAAPRSNTTMKHPRQPGKVSTDNKYKSDVSSPDGHKKKRNKVNNKAGRSYSTDSYSSGSSSPTASSSSGQSKLIPAVHSQKTAPGFQTSPKPENLPMPTSSLLLRAAASRSGASSPVLSSSGGSWSGVSLTL